MLNIFVWLTGALRGREKPTVFKPPLLKCSRLAGSPRPTPNVKGNMHITLQSIEIMQYTEFMQKNFRLLFPTLAVSS